MAQWMPMPNESSAAAARTDAGEAPAKQRAVPYGDNKEALERELNVNILAIQSSQACRHLQAAWHSFLTPLKVVSPAILCNKTHADNTRGQSGHTQGPPHIQSYRMFIATVIQIAEATPPDSEHEIKDEFQPIVALIKEHLAMYERNGVDKGWWSIDQFRVRETKDGLGVLSFQMSSLMEPNARWKLEVALVRLLLYLGATVKPGAPPRSDAERKAQTNIDTIKTKLGIQKGKGKGRGGF